MAKKSKKDKKDKKAKKADKKLKLSSKISRAASKAGATITSHPAVSEVVAAALVGAAAALRDPKKARQLANAGSDKLEALGKEAAERGSALWALALEVGRKSLETLDLVPAEEPARPARPAARPAARRKPAARKPAVTRKTAAAKPAAVRKPAARRTTARKPAASRKAPPKKS